MDIVGSEGEQQFTPAILKMLVTDTMLDSTVRETNPYIRHTIISTHTIPPH